jgi:hypothetical protein
VKLVGMKKLLPLGLLAVLAFVPLAFATKESSYKWGYKQAIESYNCTKDNCTPLDLDEACTSTMTVTNTTACTDGYVHAISKAYNDMSNPFKHGYLNGFHDGRGVGAHDSSPVCGGYNSTSDADTCYHAYDLGFKKSCNNHKHGDIENPEYITCTGWLAVIHSQH